MGKEISLGVRRVTEKKAAGKLGRKDCVWGGRGRGDFVQSGTVSEKLTFVQTLGMPRGKCPGRERQVQRSWGHMPGRC